MDKLDGIHFDKAYKKSKMLVKHWEKDFKSKHFRIPSKLDIKEAPCNIRYAYKKYFQLKSAALENSLDISCDVDENMINSPEYCFSLDNLVEHHSPDTDNLIKLLPSDQALTKLLSSEPVPATKSDANAIITDPAIPLSDNLSKKLFHNSKFNKRNPRKSIKTQSSQGILDQDKEIQFSTGLNNSHLGTTDTLNCLNDINLNTRRTTINTVSKTNSLESIHLKDNLNINNSIRQINEGWLERVTGCNIKDDRKRLPERFGIKNINIKYDNQNSNDLMPEEIVENSESDDDFTQNKPALKRRKINDNKKKYDDVDASQLSKNNSLVTKTEERITRSKKPKSKTVDEKDDTPPSVHEFIHFEVEKDIVPRHTQGYEGSRADSSSTKTPINTIVKSTSIDRLQQKIASGTLNENFVKINIEKKVFVRGKKTFNFSKYKKKQWKDKKALNAGMEFPESGKITCFKCGEMGHMARYCTAHKGDALLPLDVVDTDIIPTLEEMDHKSKALNEQNINEVEISTYKASVIPETFLNLLSDANTQRNDIMVEPMYSDMHSVEMTDVYTALNLFGHNCFRPGQEETVKRILCGYSTLLLLSTGGGKSLCYQLPAYIYSSKYKCITLVISPLVSLMEDQVNSMPEFLKAGCLHTNQPPTQRSKIIQLLKDGQLNILLISPEALISGDGSNGFGGLFKSLPPIAFACIDEAHCVSQWSHNFRPSYLMICRVLREKLKVKTILGLTATASQTTIKSVIGHINIPDGLSGVISDPNLPNNLILSVSQETDKDRSLISLLSSECINMYNSIIVYCIRRDECERIAAILRSSLQEPGKVVMEKRGKKRKQMSFVAEAYHAGMSAAQRKRIQSNFMNGALRIIVATVAFGMGINKSDIRCIIHYDMPSSFESYVQEVGRAGRDSKEAHCHVFLNNNKKDKNELLKHIHSNSIDRHTIRKLLQKVFIPCDCANLQENKANISKCKGHEVAIPIDETVEELDVAAENIATLLCYLELHPKQPVKVLHNAYTMCKIFSYGGAEKLTQAAARCPPLAMAIRLKNKYNKNTVEKCSNILEFPVVTVAAEIGWESGVTKYNLKNLEWIHDKGINRRSQFKVEFNKLGFRLRAPGDLTSSELDNMLDYLHETVVSQEKAMLYQLEEINLALRQIGPSSVQSMFAVEDNNRQIQKSNELKNIIRVYFERESNMNLEIELEQRPLEEERIVSDIRALIISYKDCNFTGRSIARIFQGIASPNYPAIVWGRCKYWRSHIHEDFYGIVRLATQQIIEMKLN